MATYNKIKLTTTNKKIELWQLIKINRLPEVANKVSCGQRIKEKIILLLIFFKKFLYLPKRKKQVL